MMRLSEVSATVTATASSVARPPVHSLHLRGALTRTERLDYFLDLLESPLVVTDSLSLKCAKWYGEVYQLIIESRETEDFLGLLAARVHEFRRFAINPIDHAPLERPIMANGKVWESWMFNHIQYLFDGFSPFDEDAELERGVENAFACELIDWQRDLFESEGIEFEKCEGLLDKNEVLALSQNKARRLYIDLTDRALELECEERKLVTLLREEERFKVVIRTTEERTAEHVGAIKVSLAAGEVRWTEALASIQEIYEEIIIGLRNCLTRTIADLEKERARVDALEGRVTILEETVRSVESRLHSAERRLANCESELSSDGGDNGCSIM